jgi:hypothetical protein
MATDPKVIAVAMAIKQSLEMNTGSGGTVQAHPNAFFLNVTGSIDLYKAAEAALRRVDSYAVAQAEAFEYNVAQLANKIGAEIRQGAVSVEDALARVKTKAGGEIIAAEGVLEEATTRAAAVLAQGRTDTATAASAVDGH